MSGPRIAVTDRIKEVANNYLDWDFIAPDVKYLNGGEQDDAEINFASGNWSNFTWRYLDGLGRIYTVGGERDWWSVNKGMFSEQKFYTERRINSRIYDKVDDNKSKLLIAAFYGIREVDKKFLDENRQAIDELRTQLFPDWQSGVSSVEQYFAKE